MRRPLALSFAAPLVLAAPLLLAAGGEDAEGEVEEVVEERAEANEGGKPEDADVGEASYNVADCTPATEEEMTDVERSDIDEECEPVVK